MTQRSISFFDICHATLLLVLSLATPLAGQQSPSTEAFQQEVLPFLKQYCFHCHSAGNTEGEFRIDNLSPDLVDGALHQWREIMERISSGQMPPADETNRPQADDAQEIVTWLDEQIKSAESTRLVQRGPVSFYRLTREEYAATIQDLLGVTVDYRDPSGLSADDQWQGIKRIGSVLNLSTSHIEKYLSTAELILDEAFPDSVPAYVNMTNSASSLAGGPRVYGQEKFDRLRESGLVEQLRVDLWPGQTIRHGPADGFFSNAGRYRIRVKLSGLRSAKGLAPHLVLRAENLDRILFEKQIVAAEEDANIVEFETHLPAGEHVLTLRNESPGPSILAKIGTSSRRPFFKMQKSDIPWQMPLIDRNGKPVYPCLIVDSVQWQGPIIDDATSQLRKKWMPSSKSKASIRETLGRFAERAFRRPLKSGEIDKYLGIVTGELAAGSTLKVSCKAAMLAMLCSKDFLFLVVGAADRNSKQLNDWELACRLSYFLWSTMPDEELAAQAQSGSLSQPDVFRSQLDRMLADSRSSRFVEAFSRQWLQLDNIGMFPPDLELYPQYDKYLERCMIRETIQYFGEMLDKDLTLREFIDSDWTILNARLATHYAIDGIQGDHWRRVQLKPKHHRGGILTHASVLSLTSDGARHRPVHRGVWISESVFGESPPPPPANVEPIEADAADAPRVTIRSKLEAHVRDPNCAACHRRIDPLGLAFDNYDAIGRWRDREIANSGTGDPPAVDASGILADGRAFSNAKELRQLVLQDMDQFNQAFVEKLATFALRRTMTIHDRKALTEIALKSKSGDYRLRQIVQTLVLSDLFHRR